MSLPLVLSLACTALLGACAPAILSVQVEPAQPPAQSAFVVKASISTTGASGSPTLRITQDIPAPAAEFGPATMTTDSAAGGNLRVSTMVPSGALRPSQNYGASMKVTVSVPWQDLLSNTNYVSASVALTVGAPANCKSFDDPGQTQGWRLRGFQRLSLSPAAPATELASVGPGLAWVATENYPGPLPHQGAVKLQLPDALRNLPWDQTQLWQIALDTDWSAPSRAVKFFVKGDLAANVSAIATARYTTELRSDYLNFRSFTVATAGVLPSTQWREIELALPQDFGHDVVPYQRADGTTATVDAPGRLAAVTLKFFGYGNNVFSTADKSVLLDYVCFVPAN